MGRRKSVNPEQLVAGVLKGDRLSIARAITHVESEGTHMSTLLTQLYPHTGHAHIIGVTGAPGTGKSTLVTVLVQQYRQQGLTVGVVAIDPTSPFTGGALLGDRVRMQALSGDTGAFVRSMATRGSLGGLSKTTGDVVTILDAAGFDRIIVETVGVGQAEVAIANTAYTTLVVEAPGLGDEVQAIKAGILEIGDILVVNKGDRPGADRTIKALEMMVEMGLELAEAKQVNHHGQWLEVEPAETDTPVDDGVWRVSVIRTAAKAGVKSESVAALRERIEAHREWLHSSGTLSARKRQRIVHTLENVLQNEIRRRIAAQLSDNSWDAVVGEIEQGTLTPYQAVSHILVA
ncbi:MAG: methylmalonyl Co-A mutase-associated GTPase MeaB [Chloroflexota bacterium]